MEEEVNSISGLLESAEWSGRVSGLKELGRLATSVRGSPENAEWLAGMLPKCPNGSRRSIVDGVQLAMRDLRSLVAAEACRCARQCAESLGSDFCCESWLEQLVVGLQSGSQPKVVAEAADQASKAVVKHVADKQAWVTSKLCEFAKRGRAPSTRTACLGYLAEACSWWPSVDATALADCVVDRARDPVGPTRAAARHLWHALDNAGPYQRETARARDLVDPGTRKQLDREVAATTKKPPPAAAAEKRPLLASVRKKKLEESAATKKVPKAEGSAPKKEPKEEGSAPKKVPKEESSATKKVPKVEDALPVRRGNDSTTPKKFVAVRQQQRDEQEGKDGDDSWLPTTTTTTKISGQEISSLVKQAQSPHWDLRRDAVLALGGGGVHSEVALRCVATCIGDAHHRVASTALKVASKFLSHAGVALDETSVCALVVNCSKRLAEGRADLKMSASSLLDKARIEIDTTKLLASVLPRLADLSPLKARAALTEFAAAVVETHPTVATKLHADIIFKLAVSLTATISDATRPAAPDAAASAFAAAARCAQTLRNVDAAGFADKVAALAPEMRRSVSEAIGEISFEDELREARTRLLANQIGPEEDDDRDSAYSDDDEDLLPKFTAMKQKLAASRRGVSSSPEEDATLAECLDSLSREAGEYGGEAASMARQRICDKARTDSPSLRRYFDRIVALLVDKGCSGDPEEDVLLSEIASRIESLAAVRVLAKWQPELFARTAQTAVPRLFGVFSQKNIPYELSLSTERALVAIAGSRASEVFDACVRRASQSTSAPVLRILAHCVPDISRAKLNADAQALLPKLARSVSAPHDPTLRKATLDLLVALYKVLGDTVIPHFKSTLPEHKLKLIATYVHQRSMPLSNKNGHDKKLHSSATKFATTSDKDDDEFAYLSSSSSGAAAASFDDSENSRRNFHTVHHQQQGGGGLAWPPPPLL